MRRLVLVLTVAALMVASIAVSAIPAAAVAGDDCVIGQNGAVTCSGDIPYIWVIQEDEWEEEPIVADSPKVREEFEEVFGSGDG